VLIDQDEHATFHLPHSGAKGVIEVPRDGSPPRLLRVRGRLAHAVPPGAPRASTSIAESVINAYHRHDAADDFAELPASRWPTKPMAPWRPPAPTMNSDDFCPAPGEPDWQRLRSTAPTKRTPPVDADFADFAPMPRSGWD
jgi:hypothetical protein